MRTACSTWAKPPKPLVDGDADALDEAIRIIRKGPRKLALASVLKDKAYLDKLASRRTDAIGLPEGSSR